MINDGKIKKVGLISVSALMLSTIATPAFSAQIADKEVEFAIDANSGLSNVKLDPDIALELCKVDYYALFGTVSSNLGINPPPQPGGITTNGLKGMAAKTAAKQCWISCLE
ncbi:hypothetical protein ACQCT3_02450 [Sutcliffiella horikoshii]|uniref:hypothetical protein n=1 Tax=Sutcliffiella horikoshii TaxID=79883 RepID=UPI003CF30A0D